MTVFDDLEAEQDRLADILAGLSGAQWATASLAPGWTVRDVVLHLAQGEELAVARLSGAPNPPAHDPAPAQPGQQAQHGRHSQDGQDGQGGRTVEQIMAALVEADPATPAQALRRWQQARGPAMDLLRAADPQRRIEWAAAPLKPAALATTRLAEHWTHGLDVTGPLGIGFPDTARLRHVAWLAHRMLPYAFGLAGQPAADIRAELTAPDGTTTWEFGPPDAASAITGDAGLFCRVAGQRLAPAQAAQAAGATGAGLQTSGPDGARALALIRTYAV
ncbi:MAG TPA: maleylpyruvate isomerase family mycothiol-dependent enzyme [Streptosporangiaceae bacterium]|jgi:uncharacterized protein (TIGR03084 family)